MHNIYPKSIIRTEVLYGPGPRTANPQRIKMVTGVIKDQMLKTGDTSI